MSRTTQDRRDPGRELDQVGGRGLLGGRAGLSCAAVSKLHGKEKNDAKQWLPGNAESTKVVDVQLRFQSPNIYPAVVVYERASGLTAADRAKAAADARSFAGLPGVGPGQVAGPIPSADGQALQTIVQVNVGPQGAGASKAADAIRAIASSNANGLTPHLTGPLTSYITGPLGINADRARYSAASTPRCCIRPWRSSS